MINHRALPRPFLKWAGGKTQIADMIVSQRPSSFNHYHEPFLGSGAVFFALVRQGLVRCATLSDINWELIETYRAIRDCPDDVLRLLADFPYSREFYYELRDKDPSELSLAERAARMIYLNKTGYNGLYRVNSSGKFNVPFGRYKSPKYFDRDNIYAVSQVLQEVELLCEPFQTVINRAQPHDWIYFDPPYVPLSNTANFTAYQVGGFGMLEQRLLRDTTIALSEAGVFVTVSNSDSTIVHELYSHPIFRIVRLTARRAINCNAAKRGPIYEVLIMNYSTVHHTAKGKQLSLPMGEGVGTISISK